MVVSVPICSVIHEIANMRTRDPVGLTPDLARR